MLEGLCAGLVKIPLIQLFTTNNISDENLALQYLKKTLKNKNVDMLWFNIKSTIWNHIVLVQQWQTEMLSQLINKTYIL